jgi:hypothetical protein
MSKTRIAVSLDEETLELLDRMQARRFGGASRGRSLAVTWALQIAEGILEDPATLGARDGYEALRGYQLSFTVEGEEEPIPETLAALLRRVDAALKEIQHVPDMLVMDTVATAREDIARTLTEIILGRKLR